MASQEKWEGLVNEGLDGGHSTNRELIDDFELLGEQAPKTKAKYVLHLEELAAWAMRPLLTLRVKDLLRFMGYLTTEGRVSVDLARPQPRGWKGGLSASTRKGYVAAFREFYRHCAAMELIEHDPTFGLKSPTVVVKPGLTLPGPQIQRLLDAPGRERDRVQVYLLTYTAARAGQIRQLRWDDVDFDGREIRLSASKKKHSIVPMHPQLWAALRRWRTTQMSQAARRPAIAAALADPETAYVLLSCNGRPLCHSTMAKQLKARAARAGIALHSPRKTMSAENKSRVHPHVLRRSWATIQRRQGTHMADIADGLNHSSVETTRTHYAFGSTPDKQRLFKSLDLTGGDE